MNKYLYVERTPTWFVRSVYVFGIIAWLLVLISFTGLMASDPFFRYFVAPLFFVFTLYNLCSYGLNLFYRQFSLKRHKILTRSFWVDRRQASVDVFLPICGEEAAILRNTWHHVAQLRHSNMRVFVLDDSREGSDENKQMAKKFGFTYFERPNKGEMKKAGNMKYAFERTNGEFIVVFDGDFAPHPDFLKETLPYMKDTRIAIVQTPQYFQATKDLHKRSPISYGAARSQEIFYRIIQVARDRLNGAHCCGTCAVYRRSALVSIGGFVQMGHSEDAHTGFGLTAKGWIVRYIPIILSIGMCPDNAHAFFHQQHRWCLGNVVLTLDKKFWDSRIPFKVRFCYLTGFLYNLQYPLFIPFSFQLFWTLIVYNPDIHLEGAVLFWPYLFFWTYCLFALPILRFRWGVLYTQFMGAYSNAHAFFTILVGRSVGWIATNSKQATVSNAFRQTVFTVSAVVLMYGVLSTLAVRGGMFHFLNHDYYSVQFWIFYNLVLSCLLLWHLYTTMDQMQRIKISNTALAFWRVKTAGVYLTLTMGLFATIILV